MRNGRELIMTRLSPCIIQNEDVISSNTKDNEKRQNMENTEVPEVKNNAVNHVRCTEGRENGEIREARDKQRTRLQPHEEENKQQTATKQRHIKVRLIDNEHLEEIKREIIEVHF